MVQTVHCLLNVFHAIITLDNKLVFWLGIFRSDLDPDSGFLKFNPVNFFGVKNYSKYVSVYRQQL
jgi:hypothetical protein